MEGTVGFLEDNGLEVGYAYFWDANIITEATEGRVKMVPIAYDTRYHVLAYLDTLTDLRCRENSFVVGKAVFLLASQAHSAYFSETELALYSVLTYEDAYYRIYAFDCPTEVWEH